jgi:hypothetical protein
MGFPIRQKALTNLLRIHRVRARQKSPAAEPTKPAKPAGTRKR